jgi:aminopeptidase N
MERVSKIMQFSLIIFILAVLATHSVKKIPDNGVSFQLAQDRQRLYRDIEYFLHLTIPLEKNRPIPGNIDIHLKVLEQAEMVLDFRERQDNLRAIRLDGKAVEYAFTNGHIVIPAKCLSPGQHRIAVDFIAGESSLNRHDDFFYSLFVPDRAATAFPCFDQPDLKAVFHLTLAIPQSWVGLSNAAVQTTTLDNSVKTLTFGATEPISTYLFALVAGKFEQISQTLAGRTCTMLHRENDRAKIQRNSAMLFRLHEQAWRWLEDYTAIPQPFAKLDFVLIPDFQYSGMEHPGALYYRDSRLLLEENASVTEKLQQANLIAHEVAHLWFGDLVTMRWFNDVWLKEVFAGFMADKIVNPQYPQIDSELSFLLAHYPRAYSVDRSSSANPIRQKLDNLLVAGSLYGDIIYHKAPIMMRQLELLMGRVPFQQGIRQYLKKFYMANADWPELIALLDPLTPLDITAWSRAWVDQPGMPDIRADIVWRDPNTIGEYRLTQSKPATSGATMGMQLALGLLAPEKMKMVDVVMTETTMAVTQLQPQPLNGGIFANADGKGYGTFFPDSASSAHWLAHPPILPDNLTRAAWLINRHELFLRGAVALTPYFNDIVANLGRESEPQIRQYLLDTLELLWWKFLDDAERQAASSGIEASLRHLLMAANLKETERKPVFWALARLAINQAALQLVYEVWNQTRVIPGVKLDEADFMRLACELAVRDYGEPAKILATQVNRLKNPDRLAKFCFIQGALDPDPGGRAAFFRSLADPAKRRPEPWVTEAIHYLHHPLRAKSSLAYLKPALDLLPEIQQTGDIFFPKSWLDATLWGYNSSAADAIVTNWLASRPDVARDLQDKVRQSADTLARAVDLRKRSGSRE